MTSHYGFAPAFVPQPLADTNADLLSDNRILSPTTNISDDHSISFGLGDITLGDKTTAHGDGAVAIGGSNHGDILSGDGAVLGNGNTVNNGSIHAGAGSNVAVGDHNGISAGNTTAGGDVLSSHDGTVIQTSGHGTTSVADGNTTTVHGNQTITDIHGSGNTSGVDNNTNVIHTSTTDNSVHDSSVHSTSVLDSSVHDSSIVDTSVHDNSAPSSSVFDSSVHNNALFDSSLHDNSIRSAVIDRVGDSGLRDLGCARLIVLTWRTPDALMASAVSMLTWLSPPDTVTLAQWPVTVTVFGLPPTVRTHAD